MRWRGRAQCACARRISTARKTVKRVRRTRSRPGSVSSVTTFSLSITDRFRQSHMAKSELWRYVPVSTRLVATVRLRVTSVCRRGFPPLGKPRQFGLVSAVRSRSEWFCDRRDLDPPGTHRPLAKENRVLEAKRIPPLPSNRSCAARPRK